MLTARRVVFACLGLAVAAAAALAAAPFFAQPGDGPPAMIKSAVVSWDAVKPIKADWGQMRRYFVGESAGTRDLLTAVAVLKPSKAIHAVHRHAEEEFLIVTEGTGTWHLNGKEFPAKSGDMLYAEPWADHGITNTSTAPLKWAVVRFSSKGTTTKAKTP